jgi:hypothetical protein
MRQQRKVNVYLIDRRDTVEQISIVLKANLNQDVEIYTFQSGNESGGTLRGYSFIDYHLDDLATICRHILRKRMPTTRRIPSRKSGEGRGVKVSTPVHFDLVNFDLFLSTSSEDSNPSSLSYRLQMILNGCEIISVVLSRYELKVFVDKIETFVRQYRILCEMI